MKNKIIAVLLASTMLFLTSCKQSTNESTTVTSDNTSTIVTTTSKPITKYSTYINLEGLSANQIFDNIWKTGYFPNDISRQDYMNRFVCQPEEISDISTTDFYWEFEIKDSKQYIEYVDVYIALGSEESKTSYSTKTTATVSIKFDEESNAKELFSTALNRYQKLGFSVISNSYDSDEKQRDVVITKNDMNYTISISDKNVILKVPAYMNEISSAPALNK